MPAGMSAPTMLVRTAWRRHWRGSVFLALIAGLAAGVVGASFQAAARADTSVARFAAGSRVFDQFVVSCPPGVNPDEFSGQTEIIERCANPANAERFRHIVDRMPAVERTAVGSTLVGALLDPKGSNHWGYLSLIQATVTPGAALPQGNPVVVAGRLPDPDAPDEIVVSDVAARVAGLHPGDRVRMAGWEQGDLDAAIDGSVAPQTRPFPSTVVGVVRYLDQVQPNSGGSLSDAIIPGNANVYAGGAWFAAHGTTLSGYGAGVLVRLRGGSAAVDRFHRALSEPPEGWFNDASPIVEISTRSVEHVIDLERQALLIFAAIAILAAIVFVGLTATRQLRRESEHTSLLAALGMTRSNLRTVNLVRALTIAVPACVVALITLVLLSPLGPLGLARELEFDHGIRVDPTVVISTVLAVVAFFAIAGLATRIETSLHARSTTRRPARALEAALRGTGPVPVVGAAIARGRSSRAAIAVTAIAVAAAIGAGGLAESYDRLVAKPERFGAWWDVVVGQYSERAPLAAGVAKVRANPAIQSAAGYEDEEDFGTVDGKDTVFLAATPYVGQPAPVLVRGRAATRDDEALVGAETARRIGKDVGDDITIVSETKETLHLRIAGIAVINDPIASESGAAGIGVILRAIPMRTFTGKGTLPQSIVIHFDPRANRQAAIESVRREFSGSIREATPQVDVRNLGHLRRVPALIAALVAILALATLVHALLTLLHRNRTTLAVLAALGFTRRQRRRVGIFASGALVLIGVLIGVPTGLVLSARIWQTVTRGIDLPARAALPWTAVALASIGALVVAVIVALVASRGTARMTPSEQLRVE